MEVLREWISIISDSWGVVTGPLGALVALLAVKVQGWLQRRARLRQLTRIASEEAIALCVRIGGQSDPLPDVEHYLRRKQPNIRKILVYQAQGDRLDESTTAGRIIEDLREVIKEIGKGQLTEVHLFVSGMIVYPIVLGALMGNWCPVVVYHMRASEGYVPLYRLTREWLQGNKRTTCALAKMKEVQLITSAGKEEVSSPPMGGGQEQR